MSKDIIELKVAGMTCNNCASSLQKFLERKGLEDVYVNFQTKEVRFDQSKQTIDLDAIKNGIHKLGFQVVEEDTPAPWWTLERKLLLSALFTLPLLLNHLLMMAGLPIAALENAWVQLLICLPPFIIGFVHFGRSGLASLKGGVPNMDVLIFVGGTAAFVYSLIGTFLQEPNYIFYETGATIFTLVLLGNWMEKRAVAQTTTAIEELGKLRAEKARLIMPSGAMVMIKEEELSPGDLVQVNEGDKIPADGVVKSGTASIDESMLTGESLPIEKGVGDKVVGGALLQSGNFQMSVTATGKDTVLSQMIELVKTAQQDKPAIQRLADKISAIFVPVVLGIALLTVLIGYFAFGLPFQQALLNAIAVLVISCPCAMGLATPTAVMVGVGRLAKNGILIKGGQTVELLSKVDNFIFDKTGTLTSGNFNIDQIEYFGNDPAWVNALIYKMEQSSSHPIAQSLVREMEKRVNGVSFENLEVQEKKGMGIIARDATGNEYAIGTSRLIPKAAQQEQGQLFVAENGEVIAAIQLSDELKKDAQSTIRYLQKAGKKAILLSGDKQEKTTAIAQKLGIEEFYGEKLPEEKLSIVGQKSKDALTAMVGDGINDAPALAKATLGISLSNASPAAIQSAQVVLLKDKLTYLQKALSISRHTVLTIKQNLFWAFAYNIVAIPIAAMGFLNPMWGALFMAFSDVIVIGNSIRLKYKKMD